MTKFRLIRTKQCAKCPWKVSTDPFEIPDGYEVERHKNLSETIADTVGFMVKTKNMACHNSDGEDEMYCVGWLKNQLGSGNNIPLRIRMMSCENAGDIRTFGKQHEKFEDTLPKQIV